MRFLVPQHPSVKAGNIRIDGDPHVRRITHQLIRGVRFDQKIVLLCFLLRACRKLPDQFLQFFPVPAGILAGLFHQLFVIRVKAKDLLGKFFLRDGNDHVLQALPVCIL